MGRDNDLVEISNFLTKNELMSAKSAGISVSGHVGAEVRLVLWYKQFFSGPLCGNEIFWGERRL